MHDLEAARVTGPHRPVPVTRSHRSTSDHSAVRDLGNVASILVSYVTNINNQVLSLEKKGRIDSREQRMDFDYIPYQMPMYPQAQCHTPVVLLLN